MVTIYGGSELTIICTEIICYNRLKKNIKTKRWTWYSSIGTWLLWFTLLQSVTKEEVMHPEQAAFDVALVQLENSKNMEVVKHLNKFKLIITGRV